jgi:hypothetical protein
MYRCWREARVFVANGSRHAAGGFVSDSTADAGHCGQPYNQFVHTCPALSPFYRTLYVSVSILIVYEAKYKRRAHVERWLRCNQPPSVAPMHDHLRL